ncbi:MAG: DUF4276 family protein [Armatimonadota bacterium]|nr:DUF4276 family protein [Armatimonadota bacterium]
MKIYVEGGGDSKDLRVRCQKAFHQLITNARPGRRQPRIVAHGGRDRTFDAFQTAHANAGADEMIVLLVDSEAPVVKGPWDHLTDRDGWQRPENASDDQCQLMVACMETWVLADRATLKIIFKELTESALFEERTLERRTKDDVQAALEKATKACPEARKYKKGKRSFQVLEKIDPSPLRANLPHFARFIDMLDRKL